MKLRYSCYAICLLRTLSLSLCPMNVDSFSMAIAQLTWLLRLVPRKGCDTHHMLVQRGSHGSIKLVQPPRRSPAGPEPTTSDFFPLHPLPPIPTNPPAIPPQKASVHFGSVSGPFGVCFGSVLGPFRGVGWGWGGVGEAWVRTPDAASSNVPPQHCCRILPVTLQLANNCVTLLSIREKKARKHKSFWPVTVRGGGLPAGCPGVKDLCAIFGTKEHKFFCPGTRLGRRR